MQTHSLLTWLLSALIVAGCDVGTMVEPGDSAATAEVTGKAPKMVPMKGRATFVADLTADPVVLDCGYGEVFFHRFNAEGINSHLGQSIATMVTDDCWVNLSDLSLGVKGRVTFTADNGDELWGVWGLKSPGLPPGETLAVWDFYAYAASDPIQFTGGTGRFEGAYGFASGGGTFDRATLLGTYWFEGVISSVGSLK
jgi:hypothetical protein